jgi:hypothetical protein
MAEDKRPEETNVRVERGWQLAIAFGQGAGTMQATRASLSLAFSTYGHLAEDRQWDSLAALILEYSRMIGRTAAAHASRAGRCVINTPDVEFALKCARDNDLEPFGPCPLTDRRG